jgi:uncharacterized protein (TIGR02453 family)
MTFRGWPTRAIDFYDGLEEDNSKSYWQANKSTYDEAVKGPMEDLLAELAGEFGAGRIFRPNRDIRFSPDKSPYKTSIAATLAGGGYIQLSAAGLGVGRGTYVMAADQLERFRAGVADEKRGAGLIQLIAAVERAGIAVTAHDTLKSAPKGYARDHPRIALLRLKGLICWKEWPVAPWLATAKAKTRVLDVLRGADPIVGWLDANVGPSTLPGSWG